MRNITRDAVDAFMRRKSFKRSNTQVVVHPTDAHLLLHEHLIATIDLLGNIMISNAGYQTNTTKERLNGIPSVSVVQKNFQWYLNGTKWDGEWIIVHYTL